MKTIVALPLLLTSMSCIAETAVCGIAIQDIQTGDKQTIEQSFELSGQPQRKHFDLPGRGNRCTLVFFGLDTGTALGREFDQLGQDYTQSDRSAIKEARPRNNLIFRVGDRHYSIETACK